MAYQRERRGAIEAVRKAAHLCEAVRRSRWVEEALSKEDRSPVTVADFGAQAVVSLELAKVFPQDRIMAEETTELLLANDALDLRNQVVESVESVLPAVDEDRLLAAIDACDDAGGPRGRRWVLDPLDGTAGFLRHRQYAIALALIEEGEVVLGVLGCPRMVQDTHRLRAVEEEGGLGCLFVGVKGEGSFQQPLHGEEQATETPIRVSAVEDPRQASLCESVDHSPRARQSQVAQKLGVEEPPVRMDSQCKYAAIARGEASIYLRLPSSDTYEEKIWDHAAGCILVREAGGQVSDVEGLPLDFTCGRTLKRNRGVLSTNARLHTTVLEAIRRVEGSEVSV